MIKSQSSKLFRLSWLACTLLLTLSFPSAPRAQDVFEKKSGPYTVHYSLFPSSFLQPEIAEAYDLPRGKNKSILNVSIRETRDDGSEHEKSANVTGSSNDLIHKKPLEFQEVREQGAIYYLAVISVSGSPTLYFELQVQPDPNGQPIDIRFQRKLFAE